MRAVGRDTELATVENALRGIAGAPAVIVISGEPGIGKTVLLRHGITFASTHGHRVLTSRPSLSEAELPFSGLADLIEPVPGHLLDGLPGPQRDALEMVLLKRVTPKPDACYRAACMAVTTLIRALASSGPVLIAVDDVQCLDLVTAGVLEFALRRLGGQPVTVLAVSGQERGEPGPLDLDSMLEGHPAVRIRLSPLTSDAVHQLLQARCGAMLSKPELRRVHDGSGGNPRLAIEIAGELTSRGSQLPAGEPLPLPDGLAGRVTARLSALPERERTALLCASALGQATLGQVRAVVNDGGTLLDEAEESGIVDVVDGQIHFRRPYLAPVIYATASPVQRRRVHASLAEVAHDAGEQAWHAALAAPNQDAQLARALEEAGQAAQNGGAVEKAGHLWELAARRTPPGDPRGLHRTVRAGACLTTAGDTRRARSMLETAASRLAPGCERARAMLWLATISYFDAGPAGAVAMCRGALAETEADQVLRAALHLRASWFADHDTPGRVRDAQAAIDILSRLAVPAQDMLSGALAARDLYRFLADCDGARDDPGLTRAALPSGGSSWEAGWAGVVLSGWTRQLDPARARDDLAAVYRRAAELGHELVVPHVLTQLADVECSLGEWGAAGAHAAEAMAAARLAGQHRVGNLALTVKALLDAQLGDIDSAREAATRGLTLATATGDPAVAASHLAVLGFAALSRQELDVADQCLSRADELVTSIGLAEPAGHRFHADHVEVAVARGDLARAAAMAERLSHRAGRASYPWIRAAAARSRAILSAAQGDLDAAIAAAGQAVAEHEHAAMPFERARTLLAVGRIRRRRKEKLLARDALAVARRIFDDLGAQLWSAHAAQELQRLGLRRGSQRNLTPSEERIAGLVADGLTNREVASALFISQKTVEASLSRVFRKLGIRSRRELRASELSGRARLEANVGTIPDSSTASSDDDVGEVCRHIMTKSGTPALPSAERMML